jgi:hypothetical protein
MRGKQVHHPNLELFHPLQEAKPIDIIDRTISPGPG